MSTKYLICQLSNEFESFVAVVELDPEYRAVLRDRMDLAASLKDKDLAWLQFFDSVEVYENSDQVEEWITENADIDFFEQELKVFCDTKPDYVGWERARVDVSYVQLDDRHCFWEVRLKHADFSLETQPIYREDLED